MVKYSYKGNRYPFAVVLCHSADSEAVEPLLQDIENKGLRLYLMNENTQTDSVLKKACSVICVMTDAFYGSETLMNTYIRAGSYDKEIISLRADDSVMPEILSNYGYSKNSIRLSKYEISEAADKILSSDALKSPAVTKEQSRAYKTMLIALICAAAAAVISIAVFFGNKTGEQPEPNSIQIAEQYGISEEDLEKVSSIVIFGDRVEYSTDESEEYDRDTFVIDSYEVDHHNWIAKDTGSSVEMGTLDDLSFLSQFPNLRSVTLLKVPAKQLPDLSAQSKLISIDIYDCGIETLEGIENCQRLAFFNILGCPLSDISPLTGSSVRDVGVVGCPNIKTLDGFYPPKLERFMIGGCDSLPCITDIVGCTDLKQLNISIQDPNAGFVSNENLREIGKCSNLRELSLNTNFELDMSFVSGLSRLEKLELDCYRISNFDSISKCANLNSLWIDLGENQYINLDVLGGLKRLKSIGIQSVAGNLDFLKELSDGNNSLTELNICSDQMDWSGVQYLDTISNFYINTKGEGCRQALESAKNVEIGQLQILNCREFDASLVPASVRNLKIAESDIDTLEGLLCNNLLELQLYDCNTLRSLSGLESFEKLHRIRVCGCIRLTDWEAIYNKSLESFEVCKRFDVPDLSQFNFADNAEIIISDIPEMTDLSCLDSLPDSLVQNGKIRISAMSDDLTNLNALLRFNADGLTVGPMLEEQATDLCERGCFNHYEIDYPDGEWNPDDLQVSLITLDELNTLPKALLKHVEHLCIAGDELYNNDWECRYESENNGIVFYMERRDGSKRNPIGYAEDTLNMEKISELTGLRSLILVGQKADNLEGIQNLTELRELVVMGCDIPDISAAFALDSIEYLCLGGSISSIEGVQNLYNLNELDLQAAQLTDISPLSGIDHSIRLCMPIKWMVDKIPDISVLADVPGFELLNMNGYRDVDWVYLLEGKQIKDAELLNCFADENDLETFVKTIKGLKRLHIGWNESVDDISFLADIEGLEWVTVSYNMDRAIHSLDGLNYNFEFEVQN